MAPAARRSPVSERASLPPDADTMMNTPARATSDHSASFARIFSPKNRAATMPTAIGWSEPMMVALTMLVSFTAEKKRAMSAPNARPPHTDAFIARHVNGVPRKCIHTTRHRPKSQKR